MQASELGVRRIVGRAAALVVDRAKSCGLLGSALLTAAVLCAGTPAQAQGSGPMASGVRLYIGLSVGEFNPDDEQLRAFVVAQEHIAHIRKQFADRGIDIRTGDQKFWKPDSWNRLRRIPISHYLVAHAKKGPNDTPDRAEIEIEWHVGKFAAGDVSPLRTPVYVAILKEGRYISIPRRSDERATAGGDEGVTIKTKSEYLDDVVDSAGRIVRHLQAILPELRSKHHYFVDCFKNVAGPVWKDVEAEMMSHLSLNLDNRHDDEAFVKLQAVFELLRPEWAHDMCKDPRYRADPTYHYREADFHIQGRIIPLELGPAVGKIRPEISIESRVAIDREQLTRQITTEFRAGEMAPLKGFCLPTQPKPTLSDLEMLATYIRTHGFKAREAVALGAWRCQ